MSFKTASKGHKCTSIKSEGKNIPLIFLLAEKTIMLLRVNAIMNNNE